ncbi:MAG: hypothetical protein GY760_07335 [Deltaproteobacteria bacterium]|nr:hypothetical protein [Deltaproteobacteria bacterium]
MNKLFLKMYILVFLALGSVSITSQTWPYDLTMEMQNAAIAIAENWVDDRNPEKQDWAWGEGVLAYGLIRTYDWSGNNQYYDFVHDYITYHSNENKDIEWSDHTSPAIAGLYIKKNIHPGQNYSLCDDVIDYIMDAPRTINQGLLLHLGYRADNWAYKMLDLPDAWIDSLFHITPSLVLKSNLTGDNQYINEAANQIKLFIQNLQDTNSKLFAHAYNDYPDNEVIPDFSNNEFWARGNGWMICALVELLAELPQSHPDYPYLLSKAVEVEEALRNNQGDDGRFHTLLTKSNSYYETAGTALILYAMAYGYELGIFGSETYNSVLDGAQGLLDNTLDWHHNDTQADVTKTSIGTNPTPGLYRFVPKQSQVSYGVGAWLMFASIIAD